MAFCTADLEGGAALGAPITAGVELDYLALGICFDPALYDRVKAMMARSEVHLGRLWLSRGKLYFDGKTVGRVMASRAPTTKYGRKLVFHFAGSWFRAGLGASDALELVRRSELTFAESGLLGDDLRDSLSWINFTSIDRVDYVLECLAGEATPETLSGRGLAHGWALSEVHSSATGTSIYGGPSLVPSASRGSQPLVNVYAWTDPQRPELGPTIRTEVRIPNVRTTSGKGSILGAALLARDQIEAVTGYKVEVIEPGESAKGLGLPLEVIDFDKKWLPDHVFNVPYSGHSTATLRRLARQGMTIIERTCSSAVLAALIPQESGFAGAPVQTMDGAELPEAARIRAGELEPEGHAVPLALQAPLTLEELEHLEQTLLEYRRTYYPGSDAVAVREALPKVRHRLRCEVLDDVIQRVASDAAEEEFPSDDRGRGDFMQNVRRGEHLSALRPVAGRLLDRYRRDLELEGDALNVQDDRRAAELSEAQEDAEEAKRWARAARAWRASCEAKFARAQLKAHKLLNVSGPARRLYEQRSEDELSAARAAVAEAAGEVIRIEELERLANEALARAEARCWDRFTQLEQGRVWINNLRIPPLVRIRSRIDDGVDAPWAYRRDTWVDEYVRFRSGDRRSLPAWAKEVF